MSIVWIFVWKSPYLVNYNITISGDGWNNALLIHGGDGRVIVSGCINERWVSAAYGLSGDNNWFPSWRRDWLGLLLQNRWYSFGQNCKQIVSKWIASAIKQLFYMRNNTNILSFTFFLKLAGQNKMEQLKWAPFLGVCTVSNIGNQNRTPEYGKMKIWDRYWNSHKNIAYTPPLHGGA